MLNNKILMHYNKIHQPDVIIKVFFYYLLWYKYIDTNNPGNYHCYNTRKISLDENYNELFTRETYDRDDNSIDVKGKKYAETDGKVINSVPIDLNQINSAYNNNIKFFLDVTSSLLQLKL